METREYIMLMRRESFLMRKRESGTMNARIGDLWEFSRKCFLIFFIKKSYSLEKLAMFVAKFAMFLGKIDFSGSLFLQH